MTDYGDRKILQLTGQLVTHLCIALELRYEPDEIRMAFGEIEEHLVVAKALFDENQIPISEPMQNILKVYAGEL